jgi:hypothetical protein
VTYQIRSKKPHEHAELERFSQRENVGLINYTSEFHARAVADALKKHAHITCVVWLDGKPLD